MTTDSRAVASLGMPIFFALKGENFDGNQYAAQAVADGAVAAVVHTLPDGIAADSAEAKPYFVVRDTLAALQELATYHREVLGLPIIALTGSNGKTTTKELIARVLRLKYRVAATKGNLNNHIGVPLTLLSFSEEDDVGIVEMGANHQGEIAVLCDVTMPNIGLITNVGRAHLEGFGGPEGVRQGKGELYDYLSTHDGTVIYASDDPVLSEMVCERFSSAGTGVAVSYRAADWGISVAGVSGEGSELLVLDTPQGKMETHMAGGYNVANVAAALAVGLYFGIPGMEGLGAVAAYEPDNNRSQVALSENGTGNTLYMDAYNANPSSMAAAIDHFLAANTAAVMGSPRVLILGDMRELGEYSTLEHKAIVDRLSIVTKVGAVECYLVGPEFSHALPASSSDKMRAFPSADALAEAIASGRVVIRDSRVLVKGSRGLALERLYRLL